MSHSRQLFGVFIAAYFVALLALAPARLAGNLIERFSSGLLTMSQTVGSVWQGQGQLSIRNHEGKHFPLGLISWTCAGWPLLLAQLEINVQQTLENQSGQLTLRIAPDGVTISKLHAFLPAEPVVTLSPVLSVLSPAGKLEFSTEKFTVQRQASQLKYQGEILALWQPALFLDGVQAGAYRLQLRGNDSPLLEGDLVTLNGKLDLQGKIHLSEKNELRMNGRVRLAPGEESRRLQPVFRALCSDGLEECRLGSGQR